MNLIISSRLIDHKVKYFRSGGQPITCYVRAVWADGVKLIVALESESGNTYVDFFECIKYDK